MDVDLWKRVDDLFNRVIEQPQEEWLAFLKDNCAGNSILLAEVSKLLAGFQKLDNGFLEPAHRDRLIRGLEPLEEEAKAADDEKSDTSLQRLRAALSLWSSFAGYDRRHSNPADVTPGLEKQRFGAFELREKLGEGGMGMVFKAVQQDPLQRTVAIKIMRQALSSSLRQRFLVEAQSLSLLSEHPYVASLYEAGTTAEGVPYFVMELIRGLPCTGFCDQHRLSIQKRLELFLKMCEGVSHAHLNGIVHRDLKPSNILVHFQNEQCIPKIIDFGVAKIIDPGRREDIQATSTHMVVGTPQYMSPEQALASKWVDMRTDVYSLGVLLYELVSGFSPYDFPRDKGLNPLVIGQIIVSQEPVPIRKRLTSRGDDIEEIATCRGTTPASLARSVNQDLHWIVTKAMAKEPQQRYQSVAELAADLRCFMQHRPVQARAPSLWYLCRSFAKRRKLTLASLLLAVVFILSNLVTTNLSLVRIRKAETAREAALRETRTRVMELEEMSGYLERLLGSTGPTEIPQPSTEPDGYAGTDVTLMQALTYADSFLDGSISPWAETRIRTILGITYLRLYDFDQAQFHLIQAEQQACATFGDEGPVTLKARFFLIIRDHQVSGDHRRAYEDLISLASLKARVLGTADPLYVGNLIEQARMLTYLGKYSQSVQLYEDLIFLMTSHPEFAEQDILALENSHAMALLKTGESARARALLVDCLDDQVRLLGSEHQEVLASRNNLALLYEEAGETSRAQALYEEVLGQRERLYGHDHLATINTMQRLARVYDKQGELEKALTLMGEVVAFRERHFPSHGDTESALNLLGGMLTKVHRYAQAEAILEELIERRIKRVGPFHESTLRARNNLVDLLKDSGQLDRAWKMGVEVLAQRRSATDHVTSKIGVAYSLVTLGEIVEAMGQDATELFHEAWLTLASTQADPSLIAYFQGLYGRALIDSGPCNEAYARLLESLQGQPDHHNDHAREILRVMGELCAIWDCPVEGFPAKKP